MLTSNWGSNCIIMLMQKTINQRNEPEMFLSGKSVWLPWRSVCASFCTPLCSKTSGEARERDSARFYIIKFCPQTTYFHGAFKPKSFA